MSRRRRASAHGRGGADCAVGSTARQSTVQGGIIVSCTTVHVVQSASGRAGQLSVQLKILLYERPLCWLGFLGFSRLPCRAFGRVLNVLCLPLPYETPKRRTRHTTRYTPQSTLTVRRGRGGGGGGGGHVTGREAPGYSRHATNAQSTNVLVDLLSSGTPSSLYMHSTPARAVSHGPISLARASSRHPGSTRRGEKPQAPDPHALVSRPHYATQAYPYAL